MKIENPLAYSFIMPDQLYLLETEKTFYRTPAVQESIVETLSLNFNYLGGHKKNFLVIVHYPTTDFIEDKHLIALESIFKRLNMGLDDIAILNLAAYPNLAFEELTQFFKPQKLLLLGKNSFPNGLDIFALNIPKKMNMCNTLYSFSFDEMMENNDHKKAFWEQMKQL